MGSLPKTQRAHQNRTALSKKAMPITSMSQMWTRLNVYTIGANGEERPVNFNNEWGGYSRYLEMPVFTSWRDRTTYDKSDKTTKALIVNEARKKERPIGVNNQLRWIRWALENNEGIAAFFIIHAADEDADVRRVKYIDADKVFVGKLVREDDRVYLVGQPRPV